MVYSIKSDPMTIDLSKLIQRKANFTDCSLLFNWKNDPNVRQASFLTDEIRFEDHVKWFSSVLNNPCILMYILKYKSSPVGVFRLDKKDYSATIDITVDTEYRGQGVGKIIISKIIQTAKKNGIRKLIADVKNNNIPSIKLFISSGFIKVVTGIKYKAPYSRYEFNVK